MYVVRPPSVLILADLQNFIHAKSFLLHHFKKLTPIKSKRTYLFLLMKLQTFRSQTFHHVNFKVVAP